MAVTHFHYDPFVLDQTCECKSKSHQSHRRPLFMCPMDYHSIHLAVTIQKPNKEKKKTKKSRY